MPSLKNRSDFSTDSEWYTYMVTHPEEFEENDEEKDKTDKKEYVKSIYLCEKCGQIIDETEKDFDKKFKDLKKDENGNIISCPKCKADSSKLKLILKDLWLSSITYLGK